MRLLIAFPFLTFGLAVIGSAASPPRDSLLVLSKGDHTLAIVDPSNFNVVAKAPVGEDPHEVIASADGRLAYVSNYGGGAYNTVAVIDLVAHKALPSIDLGAMRGPHGLDFAGGKLWFTAEGAKVIGRYDPAKKAIDWIMGTGQDRTHMLIVSSGLDRVYTTNISSATVSFLDKVNRPMPGPPPGARRGPMGPPDGNWEQTLIPVGRGAEGFDLSPDGRELWAANAQDGTVSIIDVGARKVVETLQADVPGANRLKFTPDGKHVFISSLSTAGISIVDAATRKEVKRLTRGHGAAGIQMQPDGSRAYIAYTGENYVGVVDLKTFEITGRIDAGPGPDGMAWSRIP